MNATLWRALAVLRFVTLAHAVVLDTVYSESYTEPLVGWLVVSGVALWTLLVTWAYDSPRRRRWPVLVADVGVAMVALLATPFVETRQLLAETQATVASYWVVAPILAWAIHRGWAAGVTAAVVVSAADLSMRAEISATVIGNVFLMVLAGAVVGYLSTLLRDTAAERARVTALAAQTAERERLARAVHDGVLQVLAYVQRRGPELGEEGAELASAAGEQEARLRALVQGKPFGEPGGDPDHADGRVDVGRLLSQNMSADVSVATPAGPVLLDHAVATELIAAARAILDNAEQHAPGARVFVLLENDDDGVVISIRDDGPGIEPGRLDEAEADGRMGVSRSIRGRLADLGGTATLATTPGRGTEWDLRVPRG